MGAARAEVIVDATLVQVNAAYNAAAAGLLAAVATFFLLVSGTPRTRWPRRFLGAVLLFNAAFEVAVVVAWFRATDAPRPPDDVAYFAGDAGILAFSAAAAFLVTYPTATRWRRPEGLAALGGLALVAFGWSVQELARTSLTVDPNVLGSPYTIWGRLLAKEGASFAVLLLAASAYARARALPSHERSGAYLVLAALAGGVLWDFGFLLDAFAVSSLGGPSFTPAAFAGVAGDCCHLLVIPWVAVWVVGVPLLIAAQWRAGDRVPAGLLAIGAAGNFVVVLLPFVEVWQAGYFIYLTALPLYAVVRHGALGIAATPRWTRPLLPASVFLLVFLTVTAPVLIATGGSPLGLVLGVLLGLALGGGVALAVLPRAGLWSLAWSAGEAPDATARRLGAYRAALQAEVDGGAAHEALRSKLRPLRVELGVSEQEHNALLFALGPRVAGGHELEGGALFLGRYRVERELGKGGSGTTFLCRDEVVGRSVVVKAVRAAGQADEAIRTVVREARALGGIEHPNVVRLHDVQQVGDDAYLIMEHVRGGSLKERLASGTLPREAFHRLAVDVLQGLEAVHAAGVVHRDVKPSNILFDQDGRARLAVFGVAQLPGLETTVGGRDGGPGTVQYMSPEQAKGKLVTPQSDLFSAAATLFEALTGEPYLQPGPRESVAELRIRAADPGSFRRPLRGNAALKAWFAKAMDPDPRRRFASARAMREALDQSMGSTAQSTTNPRSDRPTPST
jgi:hypothetical protein